MKIGMLWFDDSPKKSLAAKVTEAVAYYRRKYGEPNVCYVAQGAFGGGEPPEVEEVRVRPSPTVPPHHFWVGREETLAPEPAYPGPAQEGAVER
ncbi:MAG TPA: hypothetical protein G4O04_05585 [Anaerolineae bacterium]|nr:hypothetical protein [Anaerolineae bacterium]HID83533.1 hypothetical protein [Anaerolineales bacterium]HIQ09383.1 hypothetical protein [Anaerolineaceae bacterium]